MGLPSALGTGGRRVFVAHLVLNESRVPAILEKVGGVRASERMKVEAVGEAELPAVAGGTFVVAGGVVGRSLPS